MQKVKTRPLGSCAFLKPQNIPHLSQLPMSDSYSRMVSVSVSCACLLITVIKIRIIEPFQLLTASILEPKFASLSFSPIQQFL